MDVVDIYKRSYHEKATILLKNTLFSSITIPDLFEKQKTS